ncbi:ArsR family transcriptional regulator [Geobacter anodireducens]|uniref:ArsR family transcriptional regulator n=1 Tax=Geobacter anodireducens TaxID=1340425 RepID=A0ABR9NXG9_9BACT|nr:ArsR family transcriptional regulator [Geobacter anodireducens]MBE2888960.1 ArsR family transcriptional regulator [Geobacter anodireducens]
MSFADLYEEDQRLVILRLLEQDTDYTLNESMLQDCMARLGHKCSRDCVRTRLAWLKEQGLVTIAEPIGFFVATLTSRGLDVAQGVATCPGVKRPRPKA